MTKLTAYQIMTADVFKLMAMVEDAGGDWEESEDDGVHVVTIKRADGGPGSIEGRSECLWTAWAATVTAWMVLQGQGE